MTMALLCALFPIIMAILALNLSPLMADDKVCSIARHGTVRMFTGETLNVTLPCKYRLADITCGDFRVKVTPGSAVDSDGSNLFSPSSLWVKVVNTKTEDYLDIRTSLTMTERYKAGKISNPWRRKEGSVGVVEFAGYDPSREAAVLETSDVFSVELSDVQHSVLLRCSHHHFSSPPLPDTLCGDSTTQRALDSATSTLFPGSDNVTAKAVVDYIVLNHTTVVQSPTCASMASKFQGCEDKQDAAEQCQDIFGQSSQAQCLAQSATPLKDYYNDCLSAVCDGDASALDAMNQFIRDNCGKDWLHKRCQNDSACPSLHAQCFNDLLCVCRPGFYYSQSSQRCVDTCDTFYSGEGFEAYVRYVGSVMHCGEGVMKEIQYRSDNEGMELCIGGCLNTEDCVSIVLDESRTPHECTLCRFAPGHPQVNITDEGSTQRGFFVRKCV